MAFIVFDWLEEPNAKERLQKIDQALEELSELLKEVAPTGSAPRLMPKVVWKIRSFLQGLACRQLSLSRTAELCWNNGELLATATLTRSIMETSAASFNFYWQLKQAAESGRLAPIDAVVMPATFATRSEVLHDVLLPAENVLSMIDKVDRYLLQTRRASMRKRYEFLCEFAHPNWPGTVGLFGTLDTEDYSWSFSLDNALSDKIASQIVSALAVVSMVKWSHEQVLALIPPIAQISDDDRDRNLKRNVY